MWRSQRGVQYAAVEPGELLLVLPGDRLRVANVKITPLEVPPPVDAMSHPRVKWLAEAVGRFPTLRLYQYTFMPLKTRVVQRLESGAELHEVTQESAGPSVVIHAMHAYYVAYVSNSGRIYSETPGGAQAYSMVERGQLKPPQVYIRRLDKHRYEVGIKIPIDEEQVRQLITALGL